MGGWLSVNMQLVPQVLGLGSREAFVEWYNLIQDDCGLMCGKHLTYYVENLFSFLQNFKYNIIIHYLLKF